MKDCVIIGTRASALALAQANIVKSHILRKNPSLEVKLLKLRTEGDRITDRPLFEAGGKGLFVRELDRALIEGRTDLSVHSLKDVPMELAEGFPLIAYSRREDPRDALILPKGVKEPDFSQPVGCSSPRRMLQLKKLYPEAKFEPIRGNLKTRLEKLDSGAFAATILAVAGLKRLGYEERISRIFEPDEIIPAAGQGIIAVQGPADEDFGYLTGFSDPGAEACARAERAFVRALNGNCSTPIAAYAEEKDGALKIRAYYYDTDSKTEYCGAADGYADQPENLGTALAQRFLRGESGQ